MREHAERFHSDLQASNVPDHTPIHHHASFVALDGSDDVKGLVNKVTPIAPPQLTVASFLSAGEFAHFYESWNESKPFFLCCDPLEF